MSRILFLACMVGPILKFVVASEYANGDTITLATATPNIQSSWRSVQTVGGCGDDGSYPVMDIFYGHLLNTSAEASFSTVQMDGSAGQKAYLWGMLNQAVLALSDVPALLPVLHALGARHIDYGVPVPRADAEPNYDLVGTSLIYTLDQGLGDAFTADLQAEWTFLYGVIKDQMMSGGENANNATFVPDKNLAKGTVSNAANNPECVTSSSTAVTTTGGDTSDARRQSTQVAAVSTLASLLLNMMHSAPYRERMLNSDL